MTEIVSNFFGCISIMKMEDNIQIFTTHVRSRENGRITARLQVDIFTIPQIKNS